MNKRRLWIVAALSGAVIATQTTAAPALPDTFLGRLEALALVETLNARLLASNSATYTLQDWCAAHRMAKDATIHAHLLRDVQKTLSAEDRQRLAIGPHERVIYRRVELVCGDHVLSRADNWYVPARLTPAIDEALVTTDIPFGRAIKALQPRRETFAVLILWHPLPDGWEMRRMPDNYPNAKLAVPPLLFEHRALVETNGQPISLVDEQYTSDILDFPIGK